MGKNTLNENYFNFFGDCYLKIAEREFKYSKNEIIRKLTEYNHCINPEFQAQSVSPFLKRTELILFGEFGFARHNSGHSLYENSKINSTSFGGGVNLEFLIRKNWVLGFGCSQSKNFVVSNDFILTSFNVPEKLDFEFNDWDVNFFMGYRKKFNSKLSIIPKFGVLVGGFQKIRIIAIRL